MQCCFCLRSFYGDNTSRGIASSPWNDPPCDIIARPASFFKNSRLAATFLPKRSVGISDNLVHLTNLRIRLVRLNTSALYGIL